MRAPKTGLSQRAHVYRQNIGNLFIYLNGKKIHFRCTREGDDNNDDELDRAH